MRSRLVIAKLFFASTALAALGAIGIAGASPVGAATTLTEVQQALTADPVFVEPGAEAAALVDAAQVRAAVGGQRQVVAVLSSSQGDAAGGCNNLPRAIGGQRTVLVLCGYQPVAGSAILPAGRAAGILAGLARPDRTRQSYTAAVLTFIRKVQQAPLASGTGSSSDSSSSDDGVASYVVGGVVIAAAAGGVVYFRSRRRRRSADEFASSQAEIDSLYGRLGSDVATLDPGSDPVARQAMVDASERYNAAGALRSRAHTAGELAAVRDTLIEGLHAARASRRQLGLDEGPPIPQEHADQQLTSPQTVQVGGQGYQGYPSYTPGAANYFPGGTVGGAYVPGGWYRDRFWEGALLGGLAGTVFSGGFGGFGGFGGGYGIGYGSGYDNGYNSGLERGQEQAGGSHAGGDWGGGGGDWGGSGGDWGGGGGGSSGGGGSGSW